LYGLPGERDAFLQDDDFEIARGRFPREVECTGICSNHSQIDPARAHLGPKRGLVATLQDLRQLQRYLCVVDSRGDTRTSEVLYSGFDCERGRLCVEIAACAFDVDLDRGGPYRGMVVQRPLHRVCQRQRCFVIGWAAFAGGSA
jgi:hypothetical protein